METETDRQYESTLERIIQDEDHIEFDFKLTPINISPNKEVRNINSRKDA